MIDEEGYRLNVGIILCNDEGRVFWARRIGMTSWQFPQGGIQANEDPDAAMFRELHEEVGLRQEHVQVIGRTRDWLRYQLPERYIRRDSHPLCIGQKQLWYILRLISDEADIRFDCSDRPEFDAWCWVDYWRPLRDVVYFKREVYRQALTELGGLLISEQVPVNPRGFLSAQHRIATE
ncbi:RNA pyrophosphohydrolase [Methylogaea oryzae]|uniref:RNA pyrophosphohydrolase n=1 Tax=Methylogaea oryzae TaxID=1295382 RepID=A0A8D4VP18_9GAMM|nr:RNA pyrophosphohydrolase [Methylogaea oryzae]BBL71433.1 RNA pyrophosphohydrolase [Methylogaea oryzae]